MAFLPENSAIKVDAALEEKLKGASFEEIKAHLAAAAVEQHLCVEDPYDKSVLIPTELANAAPKAFAKAVTIDGVKHILEADTETALLQAETALYREAMRPAATATTQQAPQSRNERGQFASADEAAAKAELELQFKRGDIDAQTYLEKSGAVAAYLEQHGVPMSALKEVVDRQTDSTVQQSWKEATDQFLASSDWPGGERNQKLLGSKLIEMGLEDAPDKVDAIRRAYAALKSEDAVVENPETAYQRELLEARSPEEINAVNHKYLNSGIFGR